MKFKRSDREYLERRAELSRGWGARETWDVVDHWPLYCGMANLGRFMAIADLLRESLDVPGHVAEFGCFRGANLLFMAKLLRLWDPHGAKVVHGFEGFQGLTELTAEDGDASELRGRYRGSSAELRQLIELYDLADEVELHEGLIEATLPKVLASRPALSFSFVYCDVDLYAATAAMLDQIHPRLVVGGRVVFDEWNYETFPGEGIAANEFLRAHASEYAVRHVRSARQPSLVITRIR